MLKWAVLQVAINLPPVKTLTKVIMGMKNIGGKHVKLSANNDGEMTAQVETDAASIVSVFTQLSNVTMVDDGDAETSQDVERKAMHSVWVDIRSLLLFLLNQQLTSSRLVLQIVANRMALFVIDQEDEGLLLQYSIPGVSL
uniref:Checkpoint protein n=1 Tax=Plectus sambesii TaxID=2011161 RepID=A0A914XLF0_9BILA